MQECGACQTDFDKRGLHAWQHAANTPQINIADQTTIGATFYQQLLHRTLLHDGDTGFLRRHVDQYLFIHLGQSWGFLRGQRRIRSATPPRHSSGDATASP